MKKIIIMSFLLATMVLSGCGSKEKTTTCTQSQDGQSMKMTITSDGEKLGKLEEVITSKDAVKDVSEADRKAGKKNIEEMAEKQKGITTKVSFKKDDLIQTSTMEVSKLDDAALEAFGKIDGKSNYKEIKYEDYIKLIKDNAEQGGVKVTCKEN